MVSYVITGVSKGIGWSFLSELSKNPSNKVIGLVRNKLTTDKLVIEQLGGRSNITILQADLTNYETLKNAAADVSKITGGSLDYLIANAGNVSQYDAYDGLGALGADPNELTEQFRSIMDTNVLGNIHLINVFMPQILKGHGKKVTIISSGMGDADFVNEYELEMAPLYATSKAAVNMITAKFHALYKKDGILFLSICPGMVDVGHYPAEEMSVAKLQALQGLLAKFKTYQPDFAGPDTPEASVQSVLSVIENSSVEKGDGGAYLSHFGTKKWI